MDEYTKEGIKIAMFVLLLIGSMLSLFSVIGELTDANMRRAKARCEYKTIASYFPTRVVLCELFAERW